MELDKSAAFVIENMRAATELGSGNNLKQLEHIRLAFGYEAGDIPLFIVLHE